MCSNNLQESEQCSNCEPTRCEVKVKVKVKEEQFKDNGTAFTGWRAQISSGRGIPTPAVHGSQVIVGAGFGSHEVYALDAKSGSLNWSLRTGDDGPTAATMIGRMALFNTESCTLMAVDVTKGELSWEKWLGDPLLAQPAAADGRVFMAFPRGGKHWLGAFSLQTGDTQWETPIGHDVITAPIIEDSRAYIATYDGAVTCLDVANGATLWTKEMRATSAPWVYEGKVFVSQRRAQAEHSSTRRRGDETPFERSAQILARTGAPLNATAWKSAEHLGSDWGRRRKTSFHMQDADVGFAHSPAAAKLDSVRNLVGEAHVSRAWRFQGSRPVVKRGIIFEPTAEGLEARDVQTGNLIWSWTDAHAEEGERRLTTPAVSNDRVLIGTWDGRVLSLDSADGHVRWEISVGAPCHWQPVMVNGRVFAGLEDGSLVSFRTGDAGDDGWPMWGGGPGHNGLQSVTAFEAGQHRRGDRA
jgi:outer membrane protein assembly factor BamB